MLKYFYKEKEDNNMKRKILIIIIIVLLITGCKSNNKNINETKQIINNEEEIIEEKETYKDENETPISFYRLSNNTLHRIETINISPSPMEDIGIFQVYPSKEESITLSQPFGQSFFNSLSMFNTETNRIKIGFNLKYQLTDGTSISQTILNPSMTNDKYWEYLLIYLYDDYVNSGKSFYSHIEPEEYNENTLFTAIKVQSSGNVLGIDKKIELTVFTYDSEDDFDENQEYRGKSKSSLILCINNNICE